MKQSSTTITTPPVVLQAGSDGSSTIYANSTSAQVSVSAPAAQGWLSNFPYRKKITFDNSAISENLVNFTVPIVFNSSNTDFWGHVQTNGNDTRFIDADNTTELYYELEKFNHTSDDMVAWVKVPQIDASSKTDYIWIYYGNSTVNFDSYCSSSNAWDSNYGAVYHFKDGSGSKITDSTLQHNATLQSGGSHWTNGQIGGAYNFDGTSDYAVIAASTSFDVSTYTIEAWAKPNTPQVWADIMGQNDTTNGPTKFQFAAGSASTSLASDFGANNDWHTLQATGALTNGTWNWYADRIDMANTNQSLWKNGGMIASQTQSTYPCTYANGSAIGIGSDAFGAYKFRGVIDELRFSKIARSANWLKACYQYQVDRSKFTYGAEEFVSAVLKVANQVASAWNVNLLVYSSSNIVRLSNVIISFTDGTLSNQIVVSNGYITQSVGALYNLPASVGSTIYISMSSLQTNATGLSYLYIYLKVLVPNTSTYALYILAFLIN